MEAVGAAMAQPAGDPAGAVLAGAPMGAAGGYRRPSLGTAVEAASPAARPRVGLADSQWLDRVDHPVRSPHGRGGNPIEPRPHNCLLPCG